jgi:virginiamycin B lyase
MQMQERHRRAGQSRADGFTLALLASLLLISVHALPAQGEVTAILSEPHGNVWFAERGTHSIGRITRNGTISHIALHGGDEVGGLSPGPGESLWFTEPRAREVGHITATGAIREYPVPPVSPLEQGEPPSETIERTPMPEPGSITDAPDGNQWFASNGIFGAGPVYGGQIDRITESGTITEFQLPGADVQPRGLIAGPSDDIWFTQSAAAGGAIGRIAIDGKITIYPLPQGHEPGAIVSGPDGDLWFTDVVFGGRSITGRIGRVTPNGTVRFFSLPRPDTQPAGIALGPDGAIWFTAGTPHDLRAAVPDFTASVGRMTPTGAVKEYPSRHLSSEIVPGPRGHEMLFAPEGINRIASIGPHGRVREYPVRNGRSAL